MFEETRSAEQGYCGILVGEVQKKQRILVSKQMPYNVGKSRLCKASERSKVRCY